MLITAVEFMVFIIPIVIPSNSALPWFKKSSFVTLKTKSCIPAILAHGAVNGIAAIGIYFTVDGGNPFVGPAPTGIIGMIPFLAVAICMVLHLKKNEKGTA